MLCSYEPFFDIKILIANSRKHHHMGKNKPEPSFLFQWKNLKHFRYFLERCHHSFRTCVIIILRTGYYCFICLIISLHLSAYSHQSRHDCSFSDLPSSLLQVSHVPTSSSLQISTSPPQLGQVKFSGTGLTNFFIPGQVSKLDPTNHFSPLQ